MTEPDPGPDPGPRRRRRRRAVAEQGPPAPAPVEPVAPAAPVEPVEPVDRSQPAGRKRRPRERRDGEHGGGFTERGMRDLVGSGRSTVGVDGALRARDVNRPTAQDMAEAERDVQIVRRNWRPPS